MRFDGPTFARGWLAVAQAVSENPDHAHLFRAVQIETYDDGVRLTACDTRVLLSAWVPSLDYLDPEGNHDNDAEPPPVDLAPNHAVVLRDTDKRGAGLLGYAIKLLATFDKTIRNQPGNVVLDLHLVTEAPEADQETLEGMADTFGALELPDAERVLLTHAPDQHFFPDWRAQLTDRSGSRPASLRLNPHVVTQVAAVCKYAAGDFTAAFVKAGPKRYAVLVDYSCPSPIVSGIFMPKTVDGHDDPNTCEVCADEDSICLRHAAGFLGSSLRPGESITISHPDDPGDDPPPP